MGQTAENEMVVKHDPAVVAETSGGQFVAEEPVELGEGLVETVGSNPATPTLEPWTSL